MSYGKLYEYSFDSQNGADILVEISRKDYTGVSYKRALGRAPVLKRENSGCVYGTSLELYLECVEDGEYSILYTSRYDEFKVDLYKNQDLFWTGFVTPELYSEPDIAPPYDVQVIATDGLSELKNYTFSSSGINTIYAHIKSIFDNIDASRKYGLISNLRYMDNETESSKQALFDIRVNLSHMVGKSCYDVLQYILETLNAGITLNRENWVIFRETDFLHLSDNQWVNGVYSDGYQALFPVVNFGSVNNNDWWPVGQLSTVIEPAKRQVLLKSENHYTPNVLSSEWRTSSMATYDENEGAYLLSNKNDYIIQKIEFTEEIGYRLALRVRARNAGSGEKDQGVGIKLKVNSHVSSGYYDYYLTPLPVTDRGAGGYHWEMDEGYIPGELAAPSSGDTASDAQDIDIIIPLYDSRRQGFNTNSWIYAKSIEITIFNPAGNYDIYVYDVSLAKYEQFPGHQAVALIDNGARESENDINIGFTDGSTIPSAGDVFMTGVPMTSSGAVIKSWKVGTDAPANLLTTLSKDYARGIALPKMKYRGVLNVPSSRSVLPMFYQRDNTLYFAHTYSYDLLNDELDVELISVSSADVSVSSVVITEMSVSSGKTASTSSGNSSIGGAVSIPRDKQMSDTSDNAVENKVIKAYVDQAKKEVEDLFASMWQLIGARVVTDKKTVVENDLIVEGDVATGGSGGRATESNCLGPIELDMQSISDLGTYTKAQMDGFGLTTAVVSNMLLGLYTKVVGIGGGDVYDYTCFGNTNICKIFLRQGNGVSLDYTYTLAYDGTKWTVTEN